MKKIGDKCVLSDLVVGQKAKILKLNEIDKALADVRVADPAVGSGAFPVGMMNGSI